MVDKKHTRNDVNAEVSVCCTLDSVSRHHCQNRQKYKYRILGLLPRVLRNSEKSKVLTIAKMFLFIRNGLGLVQ